MGRLRDMLDRKDLLDVSNVPELPDAGKMVRLVGSAEQCLTGDVLFPFALEELESLRTGGEGVPALHLWRHERAVVLGLRDRKLPAADEAVAWLRRQGYSVGVRSSGGAAVPLDEGVLNVTLILPKEPGRFGLRGEFRLMAEVIADAVRACGLEARAGEIAGAYCPGEFDLGVGGRKFCGIAQRRLVRAVAVQAFVNVTGAGRERAALVRSYYERAARAVVGPSGRTDEQPDGRFDGRSGVCGLPGAAGLNAPVSLPPSSSLPLYPDVREESMASLEELLGGGEKRLNVRMFAELVKRAVRSRLGAPLVPVEPAAGAGEIRAMADLMRRRYDG